MMMIMMMMMMMMMMMIYSIDSIYCQEVWWNVTVGVFLREDEKGCDLALLQLATFHKKIAQSIPFLAQGFRKFAPTIKMEPARSVIDVEEDGGPGTSNSLVPFEPDSPSKRAKRSDVVASTSGIDQTPVGDPYPVYYSRVSHILPCPYASHCSVPGWKICCARGSSWFCWPCPWISKHTTA